MEIESRDQEEGGFEKGYQVSPGPSRSWSTVNGMEILMCRLAIEIPITLSRPSPRKSPLTSDASKSLSNGTLHAEFAILPSPSSSPPQRIPFTLSLNPSSPISQADWKISVGLCRHTWTKGIDTSLGSPEGHDFPGIIVGSLGPGRPGPGTIDLRDGEKGWIVEGIYEVGEGSSSVRGCGLRVSVSFVQLSDS